MKSFKVILLILSMASISFTKASSIDSFKFKANSEGYALDALLLKKNNISKPMPAVIFLVGSGGNASTHTNYKKFCDFFLAEKLLPKDIAMVYFDKRGIGQSEGIWYETSLPQRAIDAKNVALSLGQFDFIDTEKIYLVGHSQGGWIAQIAIAEYPDIFAGGISMAGAPFGVKKQILNDYKSEFICDKGMSEEKALKKAHSKLKRNLLLVNIFGRKGNLKQLKLIQDFKPQKHIQSINKPFLMLFGEQDVLVDINWSKQELNKIFPQSLPSNLTVSVSANENHSFKTADKCYRGKWSDIYYSELSRDKIYTWFMEQLKADL